MQRRKLEWTVSIRVYDVAALAASHHQSPLIYPCHAEFTVQNVRGRLTEMEAEAEIGAAEYTIQVAMKRALAPKSGRAEVTILVRAIQASTLAGKGGPILPVTVAILLLGASSERLKIAFPPSQALMAS